MSATQAFLDLYRATQRDLCVLVKIEPRDPVTLAPTPIYLATAVVSTPAGTDPVTGLSVGRQYWKPFIRDHSSIAAPGDFASTAVGLCSTTIVVAAQAIPANLLLDGARVTCYEWGPALAAFDDAHPVLVGGSVLNYDADASIITLTVRQRVDWNREISVIEVTPERFPQAPEDSIGQIVPTVYGRVRDIPFRFPWPEFPAVTDLTLGGVRSAVQLIGGRRVGAAVLVDTGRGAGAANNPKAKILAAAHKCRTVYDTISPFFGNGFYMKLGDQLCPILPVDLVNDVINTTTEAGILIPDNAAVAWASSRPVDVDVVANSADNPRACLDRWNDSNFSTLNWTALLRTVRMKLGGLTDAGEMAEIWVFALYRSPANTNLKLRVRNTTSGAFVDVAMPVSTTRKVVMARVQTAWATPFSATPWGFGDIELEFGWPTSTPVITGTGTAEFYGAGLAVRFKPRQDVIKSEKVIDHNKTRPISMFHGKGGAPVGLVIWQPYTERETLPATTELKGAFFANLEGYADDGEVAPAGTFTGGGSTALIELGPDVIAHVLQKSGGEPTSAIERGVGAYGSFVDARALAGIALGLSIGEKVDVMTALAWLSQATVSQVLLDRFTDKWRLVPWRPDTAGNYPWKFKPTDVVEGTSLAIERTPLSRVMTGVALGYGRDANSGQMQHQTRLAWDGSNGGYTRFGTRDAGLIVEAGKNDRLDFDSGAPHTALLTAGEYDVPGACGMVDAALNTIFPGLYVVCNGATIIAGYNDIVTYRIDGTDRTSPPAVAGTYPTMQSMGQAYANAMQAVAGGRTIVIAYAGAGQFSIQAQDLIGHSSVSLTIYPTVGDPRSRRAYATLGYDTGIAPPADINAIQAPYLRLLETFAIGYLDGPVNFLWRTGANGLDGAQRNASSFLGFRTVRDSYESGLTQRSYLGDCPKSNREAPLRVTKLRYGAKKDVTEDLRAILDTAAAVEVRNRVAVLFGKPRPIVTFSTAKAPDLERGRVIEFSAAFDAVIDYRRGDPDSDGTWAGKRFVVVETEQLLGPVAFYMKIRAVGLN